MCVYCVYCVCERETKREAGREGGRESDVTSTCVILDLLVECRRVVNTHLHSYETCVMCDCHWELV